MRKTFLVLLTVALLASGCAAKDVQSGTGARIKVLATNPQLADIARNVGGGRVEVQEIVRTDRDPRGYQPSEADLAVLSKAELIVRNGAGLDNWLDPAIEKALPEAPVVDASKGVQLRTIGTAPDPRYWTNPQNVKQIGANIVEGLKGIAPTDVDVFDSELSRFNGQLDQLDADIAKKIEALSNKALVTDRDVFGYYATRYDMRFVTAVVPGSESEPTSAQASAAASQIRSSGAKAIFAEQATKSDAADAVARQSGVKLIDGDAGLYVDTFGDTSELSTYLGSMRHNTDSIVAALS